MIKYMYDVHMKKRITIYLDEDILDAFRSRAEETGAGYQTMINETLKDALEQERAAPTRRSLAELLLEMPVIDGHDDLFERVDDFPDRDVLD